MVEQAIKPEVFINRIDFEHFRIILAIGREKTRNKTNAGNAWKGKGEVKAVAPLQQREKGRGEDKMFQLLR